MTSAAHVALRSNGRPASVRFPSMAPTLADRISTLLARTGTLAWLYALVPVPLFTDWIENGALPTSPRGWITEVVGGIVIGALVTMVRRNQRALETLARTDGLTGLCNRRAFETAVESECARARRSGAALSIVYLDIDRFKRINDRFGHAAGDQVLRQVAHAIRATIPAQRRGDVSAEAGAPRQTRRLTHAAVCRAAKRRRNAGGRTRLTFG